VFSLCSEHSSRARSRHRRSQPLVAGGRKASHCGGEERESGRAKQTQDPKTPGGHEGQVQDPPAEVQKH